MRFPEVERVLGKAGRAETSTDPAPFSMMETDRHCSSRKSEWRKTATLVLDAGRREWLQPLLPPHHARSHLARSELVDEMNEALQLPGRVERLDDADQEPHRHADHRHPHAGRASRSSAPTSRRSSGSAQQIEALLPRVPGTRSVFAERIGGGYFLDFDWKRDQLARYGLSDRRRADDRDERHRRRERHAPRSKAASAIPSTSATMRDFRSDLDALGRVLVPAMDGKHADPARRSSPTSSCATGPAMMRDENGMLTGYVYVDVAGRDIGSYVAEAKQRGARRACSCRRATRWPGAASTKRWSACASG